MQWCVMGYIQSGRHLWNRNKNHRLAFSTILHVRSHRKLLRWKMFEWLVDSITDFKAQICRFKCALVTYGYTQGIESLPGVRTDAINRWFGRACSFDFFYCNKSKESLYTDSLWKSVFSAFVLIFVFCNKTLNWRKVVEACSEEPFLFRH